MLNATDALGERGRDLNLKDVAEWLKKEKGLLIAVQLYEGYYSPLSHFFPHSSGFALMRHVDADGKLRHRPAFPWARRSAVRIADGCAGLMATAIADKTGVPANGFLRYAAAHLDRALTPAFVTAVKGWWRAIGWRKLPATLSGITAFGRYMRARTRRPARLNAKRTSGSSSAICSAQRLGRRVLGVLGGQRSWSGVRPSHLASRRTSSSASWSG